MAETEGYKGHQAGSNKGKVHKIFDEKGPEAAMKKGLSLDLSPNTIRTWISSKFASAAKLAAKAEKNGSKKSAKNNARKAAGKPKSKKKPTREKLAA